MTPAGTRTVQQATVEAVRGGLRRALEKEDLRVGKGWLPSGARAVALRAAPVWHGPDEVEIEHGGRPVRARVAVAPTVLAALAELGRPPAPGADRLVLLTPCEEAELGPSLLGRLLCHEVFTVDSWELLADELGLRMLDPRLHSREWSWLAEALRDVGSAAEWRRAAAVLKLDDAVRRVAAIRFGQEAGDRIDAAALLDWTRRPTLVTRFGELREDEHRGLRAHLERETGAVARVVFRMLDKGQVHDAIPAGLVFRELLAADGAGRPGAPEARARAEERFVGSPAPRPETLSRFAESSEAVLLRMMDGEEHDAAVQAGDRAEEILAELGADGIAADSRVLGTGLQARLAALGAEIGAAVRPGAPDPEPRDLAPVEEALTRLWEHRRFDAASPWGADAVAAVRLTRWLASAPKEPRTVAEGVAAHIADTAWTDRAASRIWSSRTEVAALRSAYRGLYARVRDRRAEIDEAFARRVAAWTEVSAHTDGLLLAENILQRIARPLAAAGHAPLVVVLDGMSAEVAVQIGAEIAAGGRFTEIARSARGREGALATLPSVTTCSRASLLCGRLTTGGQSEEREGFATLWGQRSGRPRPATLLYQRDLEAGVGEALPEAVQDAVADTERVVAAVVNIVDDALGDGREADSAGWRIEQIGKLGALLEAAARAGRPVVLTSDHGHVWDRGESTRTEKGEAARYRTGEPGERELLVTGDRVLAGGGRIVVPWDERVRYTSRKEGYHGGISTAEMVIPVLVFAPDAALAPREWAALRPAQHEPAWWTQPLTVEPRAGAAPEGAGPAGKTRRSAPAQEAALFGADEAHGGTLGERVTESPAFEASRSQVPRGPSGEEVAAVVDTLVQAGGARPRLPVGAVAEAAGKEPYRAVRFLKMVAKVLNVETFPVLTLTDAERAVELNTGLLREQFLPGER
ncbi:BREX-2 system phosphatase PglZ [Actinorugispora endophytica]|uniref:PglZ domain-containing protein n=1 Tax=Actinorugispora endophytica TaxID=1605990 RepID=A0A4R6V1M6_9ACTN|nr:BREX-2 system phosphatase PglZ [Actinorugispora endophytica]TDQ53764.1 PglZ domain-containing protein [Actinorugispora endophytica]